MKVLLSSLCALCAIAVLLSGCETNSSSSSRSTSASHEQPDPIEIPPHNGMTKDQVVAQYGQPRAIFVTERGEVWRYILNPGEIATKALIPFYPPVRPRFGTVVFGPDNRVKEYNWQPDPER